MVQHNVVLPVASVTSVTQLEYYLIKIRPVVDIVFPRVGYSQVEQLRY